MQHRDRSAAFGYSLELENALLELFGMRSRWGGNAASFADPKAARDAVVDASRKIRSVVRSIPTADDRLLLTLGITLDQLESSAKRMPTDGSAMLDVVGSLIRLIAHLLGYDWMLGSPNRTIIYHQTVDQLIGDDSRRHPRTKERPPSLEVEKRIELVAALFDQGLRKAQIANIMNITELNVESILVRSGRSKRSRKG